MQLTIRRIRAGIGSLLLTAALGLFGGCAAPVPKVSDQTLDMSAAVAQMSDSLAAQVNASGSVIGQMGNVLDLKQRHVIVLDPMIDSGSGMHTVLAADFSRLLAERMGATHKEFDVIPVSPESLRKAPYLMVGTIAVETAGARRAAGNVAIAQVAVVSRETGIVVAQARARIGGSGFDLTPSRFEQESPVVALDKAVLGYIRTAAAPVRQPADAAYLRQIVASTSIDRGADDLRDGKYADAARHFQDALSQPSGDQLRALNGMYLADVKLGHMDQAEQVFGRIVVLGIGNRNLGVKFLFNPASTEFWSDPQVSKPYGMWIRQVAHGIDHSNTCVSVVGHASHSGTEQQNDKLSEERALRIRQLLVNEVSRIAPHVSAKGMGDRQNIIGTGTDDIRDAVDRRVAFEFESCRS